jgi:hypothetical protein
VTRATRTACGSSCMSITSTNYIRPLPVRNDVRCLPARRRGSGPARR